MRSLILSIISIQWFSDNFLNVKRLISKGVDTNAKNYLGRTALHLAAERGKILT